MPHARAVDGGWQVLDHEANPTGTGDGLVHVLGGGLVLLLALGVTVLGVLIGKVGAAVALFLTFLGPLGLVGAVVMGFGLVKLYERRAADPGVLVSADWPLVAGQAAPMTFKRRLLWRTHLVGPARLAWSVVGARDLGELDLGPFEFRQDGQVVEANWLVPVPTPEEAAERLGVAPEALQGAVWRLVIGLDTGSGPAADSVYRFPVEPALTTS